MGKQIKSIQGYLINNSNVIATSAFAILLSLSCLAQAAESDGFQSGSHFSVESVSGDLIVYCHGDTYNPPFSRVTQCFGYEMTPGARDYFVGPKVNADHVTLWAQYEDGTRSKEKTEKYLPELGRSKGTFNLGIKTLLQKPLLAIGKNTVHYTLSKKDVPVLNGEFTVEVTDNGSRQCRYSGRYYSFNSNDCNFPQSYCNEYLNDPRYCN